MADPAFPNTFASRSAYWTLATLFVIDLVVYMDRSVLAAALNPVEKEFGLGDGAGGLLPSIYTVSYCATMPLIGWLSDRVARKHLLAVGIGFWSLTTLVTGLAQTYEQMLIARSLTGIGEATCAPLGPILIADCFPRRQRSRALAMLFAAIPIGMAIGFLTEGQAVAWLDWRWGFFLTGFLAISAACLALTIAEPRRGSQDLLDVGAQAPQHASSISWRDYVGLLRNRSFCFTTLGMALMVFTMVGLSTWGSKFLTKLHGLTETEADTYLGILVGVTGIGGAALGGWLGDKLAARSPGALLWLIGAATLAAVPCLAGALVSSHAAVILSCLALALTLLCFNVGPLDTVLVNVTAPRIRGAAFAFNVLVIHLLGEMPAPFVIGVISESTDNLLWGLALAVLVLFLAGSIYCAGARFLRADQERALQ